MKAGLKQQAVRLRKNGWSYTIIANRLQVSKSTLSVWLREVPYTPNAQVRKRIREGPAKAAEIINKKRRKRIQEGKEWGEKEIGGLTKRDLLILGIGLYIGEGSKMCEQVQICNSDPRVIKLALDWFRKVFQIPNNHFMIAVHIYPDITESVAIKYWSRVTGIPATQFGKTQVDRRTNKSKRKQRILPYGTARVSVKARGNSSLGLQLHRRIMGMIESSYNQAGIV